MLPGSAKGTELDVDMVGQHAVAEGALIEAKVTNASPGLAAARLGPQKPAPSEIEGIVAGKSLDIDADNAMVSREAPDSLKSVMVSMPSPAVRLAATVAVERGDVSVGVGAEIGIEDLVVSAEARTAGGRADVGRDGRTVEVGDVADGNDGAGRNARRRRRPAKTTLADVEGAAGPFAIGKEDCRAARWGKRGDARALQARVRGHGKLGDHRLVARGLGTTELAGRTTEPITGASWSSGPRASRSLMLMSARSGADMLWLHLPRRFSVQCPRKACLSVSAADCVTVSIGTKAAPNITIVGSG